MKQQKDFLSYNKKKTRKHEHLEIPGDLICYVSLAQLMAYFLGDFQFSFQ
jgi:hypothetical protein